MPESNTWFKNIGNVALFVFSIALLAVLAFLNSSLFRDNSFLFFGIFITLFLIFQMKMDIRRKHSLDDIFSIILVGSSVILIVSLDILLGLDIINSVGYLAVSIVAISAFTLLYAWVGRALRKENVVSNQRKPKIISTLFVIIAIITLIFSFTLTSHLEGRLTRVNHQEGIIGTDFRIKQPFPDTEVSANLTSQDTLYLGILVARIVGLPAGNTSIDFQISDPPSQSSVLPNVYFYKNNITNHLDTNWNVPQNGTYYFKFH